MRRGFFPALALAGAALMAMPFGTQALAPVISGEVEKARAQRRKAAAPMVPRRYRSRGVQAKPRRRSNRLHISRRVRRQHRRAR